jgi:hypothetical protein
MADSSADQKTMIHVNNDDHGRVTLRVTASGKATEAYLSPAEGRVVADMLDRHGRLADQNAQASTSFIGSGPGPLAAEDNAAARRIEAVPMPERT